MQTRSDDIVAAVSSHSVAVHLRVAAHAAPSLFAEDAVTPILDQLKLNFSKWQELKAIEERALAEAEGNEGGDDAGGEKDDDVVADVEGHGDDDVACDSVDVVVDVEGHGDE